MYISATDDCQQVTMWVNVSKVVWVSLPSVMDFTARDRLARGLGGGWSSVEQPRPWQELDRK